MKRYFILFSLFIIALASCKKSGDSFDANKQAATDDAAIKAYLATYNITATKDASGLYYVIDNPGTGAHPTVSSGISVSYNATLLDGTFVESKTSKYFSPLSDLIKGWQIGIPKLGAGGTMKMFIPSGLGYGNVAQGSVPANSILVYDITLQGFN
jgi:FKBP-type peptidyl-prolyl cis-trans isomerase FkpA